MRAFIMIVAAGLLASCGVVGPPLPPEFVGVAPTIAKQKQQHAIQAEKRTTESTEPDTTVGGHDIDLPPSQPVEIR
jgi:predicted small lipoprotein YifL